MLKYKGDSMHSVLYRVVFGIWRTEQVSQDFLLPIPEKGDASLCAAIAPLPHRA